VMSVNCVSKSGLGNGQEITKDRRSRERFTKPGVLLSQVSRVLGRIDQHEGATRLFWSENN